MPFVLSSASSLTSADSEGKVVPLSAYGRLTQVLSGRDALQHGSSLFSGLVPAAGLATGILLISGAIARRNAPESILDRRKSRHKRDTSVEEVISQVSRPAVIADVLSRIFSIFLPLLATSKLGGMQVGLIYLALIMAGSTNAGLSKTNTVKERTSTIFKNKFTLGALALQLLYDAWTSTPTNASSLLLGYAALILSLIVFQIPLPSSRRALSISGPGTSSTPAGFVAWVTPTMTSSLTSSTHDADMTLAAAITLLIPTALSTLFSSSPLLRLPSKFNVFALLSLISGIALVFLAEPSSIRSRGRVSFAISGLAILAFLAFRARSGVDLLAALLPCVFVVGVELDRAFHHSRPREHSHDHDHQRNRKHSAFTGFLLKQCDEEGVLHGILLERDSRRILYFTT